MKNLVAKALILIIFTAGCAGRPANPVMSNQYGDAKKSCASLETELSFIQSEIQRLNPKTEKTGKNVALGVAGAFFLVPWFFMDFSSAEEQEINAYRQRYMNLSSIAEDKQCSLEIAPFPIPAKEEREKLKEAYPNSKN